MAILLFVMNKMKRHKRDYLPSLLKAITFTLLSNLFITMVFLDCHKREKDDMRTFQFAEANKDKNYQLSPHWVVPRHEYLDNMHASRVTFMLCKHAWWVCSCKMIHSIGFALKGRKMHKTSLFPHMCTRVKYIPHTLILWSYRWWLEVPGNLSWMGVYPSLPPTPYLPLKFLL